jgi:hypothetical protein
MNQQESDISKGADIDRTITITMIFAFNLHL